MHPVSIRSYVHGISFQFHAFMHLSPRGVLPFPYSSVSLSYAIMLQAGLHEITVNLSESFGYLLARSLVLPDGWSFGKANAKGGPKLQNA